MESRIDSLNVICWNARIIRNKCTEFFNFLCVNKVDVCLVCETWLNSSVKFSHSLYTCHRLDRNDDIGGGVAIVVKKNLVHNLIPIVKTNVFESIGIEISLNDDSKFKIISIYFPGGASNAQKIGFFKSDLRKLIRNDSKFLIGGDFNCRHRSWGCQRANKWGNLLFDFINRNPISLLYPNGPTYFPANKKSSPSTLDLILTNCIELVTQPTTIHALSSDHIPLNCDILLSGKRSNVEYLDLKNANWNRFRSKVKRCLRDTSCELDNISNYQQVDEKVEIITKSILDSIDDSCPKKSITNRTTVLPAYNG